MRTSSVSHFHVKINIDEHYFYSTVQIRFRRTLFLFDINDNNSWMEKYVLWATLQWVYSVWGCHMLCEIFYRLCCAINEPSPKHVEWLYNDYKRYWGWTAVAGYMRTLSFMMNEKITRSKSYQCMCTYTYIQRFTQISYEEIIWTII